MTATKPLAVIAFGGNALVPDAGHLSVDDQYPVIRKMCSVLVDIIQDGWNVVITHGNGPQVGVVMRRVELTMKEVVPVTLDYAVSYTQGTIGYMFSLGMANEFARRGLENRALAMICEVLVDADDPAFANPTKPIGSWYPRTTAEELAKGNGWSITEDSGRGWRRTVPSPRPRGIVQLPVIRSMVEQGITVVTAGGGGIPVVRNGNGELSGVEAVVDKDFASSLLARELGADALLFPTAVRQVAVGFNRPDQRWLDRLTVAEALAYCRQGEFPAGSMEPKIRALIEFVQASGNTGIITDMDHLGEALRGRAGTKLVPR